MIFYILDFDILNYVNDKNFLAGDLSTIPIMWVLYVTIIRISSNSGGPEKFSNYIVDHWNFGVPHLGQQKGLVADQEFQRIEVIVKDLNIPHWGKFCGWEFHAHSCISLTNLVSMSKSSMGWT